ncbi:alpha/beta fold hydrolase [Streptomyces sp. GQFP]|uniref:alpha/beta fold hydrolase n=1 Tax=Streptomyces sp. GQFP TaxID=2907545 RepID=UPI001F1950ED|nr:alpha/beta hydrolase [Streptomyces sp. GQFP]UIX29168.1 alpha/beta fold hydrolase [Streptomyces sp. GQFP]
MTTGARISTSRIPVGEAEIHLNESGDPDAPAILFLHGSGPGATGASNWEGVLADLGKDYHCLAPDVLGFGDSTHPNPPPAGLAPFTQLRIDTMIGLLDKLGIDQATLVGNSMGGMWSIGITGQASERVDKLVLMGAGGSPPEFFGPSLPHLVNFYDDPSTEAMTGLLRDFLHDPERLGGRLDEIAAARLPRAVRPEVERSHRATFDMSQPWRITVDDLAAITQETLIIHGREDKFVTFGGGVYYFQHIPNARIYGIGNCGHWTQIEHHEKFVAAMRGFLAGAL